MSNYNKILDCAYRPSKQTPYELFIDFNPNLCLGYNDIVIAEDFNSDLLTERKFSLGLFPVSILTPTHITPYSSFLWDI